MPPYATGRRTGERPEDPATIDYMMRVTEPMAKESLSIPHPAPRDTYPGESCGLFTRIKFGVKIL